MKLISLGHSFRIGIPTSKTPNLTAFGNNKPSLGSFYSSAAGGNFSPTESPLEGSVHNKKKSYFAPNS
jgi:hypothetical protein